jgi:hypothetical protein
MSELGPGCGKNVHEQRMRRIVFSLSSFSGDCQSGSFVIQRNRDKLSTRKLDVGVFTQPGSKAALGPRLSKVCSSLNNGHGATAAASPSVWRLPQAEIANQIFGQTVY